MTRSREKRSYRRWSGGSSAAYDIRENPFYKYIEVYKGPIYDIITEAVPTREPEGHYDLVGDYPRRQGKYIRPGLVMLLNELCGGKPESALRVAASMQLSEDWILVHDDIEDGSLTRRGGPALHRRDDSSVELALNAGDALHMIQWKVLLDSRLDLGPDLCFAVFDEMNDFLMVTAEGQYIEMKWTQDNLFTDVEDYYKVVDRKTGSYTIGGPMRLGAICAGAREDVLSDLAELAVPLGRAFQIHDDWLDIYSDDLDKDLYGDLIEGKRTLLIQRAHNEADENERSRMVEFFAKPREQREGDKELVPFMLGLFEKYGCRDHVRTAALENADRSRKLIDGLSWMNEDGKKRMNEVVDLIILREK